MEQEQDQTIPMTPEELEAEAAYAEEIYQRFKDADPEEFREIIKSRMPSKAASVTDQKSKPFS